MQIELLLTVVAGAGLVTGLGFGLAHGLAKRRRRRALDAWILSRQRQVALYTQAGSRAGQGPVIVVSGGVHWQASDREYSAAQAFLRSIQASEQVVIVPGDHDVEVADRRLRVAEFVDRFADTFLPDRMKDEQLGDTRERRDTYLREGRSRWWVTVWFTVQVAWAFYAAFTGKGAAAPKKSPQ